MIHQVELPGLTRKRLTDVVYLQMWLLRYASSTSTIDKQGCEHYLKRHPRFRGRHKEIADWLWRGHKRRELLEEFSQGSQAEKRAWSRCLSREVFALLKNPVGSVTPHFDKNSTPFWQKAGAQFLRKFYDYLGEGLPDCFFSETNASSFNRHEFIFQFEQTNNQILVCPACDISTNRTQIDHYLPISLYPHLSCHPFNLVPVCNDCNFLLIKGNTDWLVRSPDTRRNLEDVFLLYQGYGLGTLTYLRIDLERDYRNPAEMELKPRQGENLRECLEAYHDAYKIPDRWTDRVRSLQNELFRQIQQSIRAAKTRQAVINIFDVQDVLEDLLTSLYDNQGKTPLAFPMAWWLATLINQEVEPATKNTIPIAIENFPFLAEIAGWINQNEIQHPAYINKPHLEQARKLRKIVAEEL